MLQIQTLQEIAPAESLNLCWSATDRQQWITFSGLSSHNGILFSQTEEVEGRGKQNKITQLPENKAGGHCPASKTHAETVRPSRLESPALEGICVIVWHGSLCQMASLWREPPPILVKMPPHWLVQGMLNPSCGRSQFATIQLQLQIFSSTRGFEAIQIWWLLRSSWRGEAESWALHWYALFTYCLCVHLLIWRTDAARFFCGGHTGSLARITIIWHYPAVSWNFKDSNNSQAGGDRYE